MTGPLVFLDADVLFAASASPKTDGASRVVLRMSEISLITCVTSVQAATEAERNLGERFPARVSTFHQFLRLCLTVVPNPALADLAPLNLRHLR